MSVVRSARTVLRSPRRDGHIHSARGPQASPMWSRRDLLTAAVGAALAPLSPEQMAPRTGAQWLHDVEALERRFGSLTPDEIAARARRLLADLDAAIDTACHAWQRRPLHAAAGMTACIAARACRWRGGNPAVYVLMAAEHAAACDHGPTRAAAILVRLPTATIPVEGAAAAVSAGAAADEALYEVAEGRRGVRRRGQARWWQAWSAAVLGEPATARVAVRLAQRDSAEAGWPDHAIEGMHGMVTDRAGEPEAVPTLRRALLRCQRVGATADWVDISTALACALARRGEADEAASLLVGAAASPAAAPGRLVTIRRASLLIPPGPHRTHLDNVLR
jgi:hypothetical protein